MAIDDVAALRESSGVGVGEREDTTEASQALVGLLCCRGRRAVERGRVVVVAAAVVVVMVVDGFIEVRLSRVVVVDHD